MWIYHTFEHELYILRRERTKIRTYYTYYICQKEKKKERKEKGIYILPLWRKPTSSLVCRDVCTIDAQRISSFFRSRRSVSPDDTTSAAHFRLSPLTFPRRLKWIKSGALIWSGALKRTVGRASYCELSNRTVHGFDNELLIKLTRSNEPPVPRSAYKIFPFRRSSTGRGRFFPFFFTFLVFSTSKIFTLNFTLRIWRNTRARRANLFFERVDYAINEIGRTNELCVYVDEIGWERNSIYRDRCLENF